MGQETWSNKKWLDEQLAAGKVLPVESTDPNFTTINTTGNAVIGGTLTTNDDLSIAPSKKIKSTNPSYTGEVTFNQLTNNQLLISNTPDVYVRLDGDNSIIRLYSIGDIELSADGKVIIEQLPTSDAGLPTGGLFTQTAAQLGGTGSTKVLCVK